MMRVNSWRVIWTPAVQRMPHSWHPSQRKSAMASRSSTAHYTRDAPGGGEPGADIAFDNRLRSE